VNAMALVFFIIIGGFVAACFAVGGVLKRNVRRQGGRDGAAGYGWPGDQGPFGQGGGHHGGHHGGGGFGGGHHGGGFGGGHGGGGGGDHGGGGGGHHG
jgi:hypothetical protein